jgi:trk system potassium uptake protein
VESIWGQALLALLAVGGFFLAVALGVAVLAWTGTRPTPRRTGPRQDPGEGGPVRAGRQRAASTWLAIRRSWRLPGAATAAVGALTRHPARLVVLGFGAAIGTGWLLLSLPIATRTGESAGA